MKPFDLEAAKNGAPVRTRDGRRVRIVCFDKEGVYPIIALVGEGEHIYLYPSTGKYNICTDSTLDLMMYEKPEHQFKPFDRVLVRDEYNEEWHADIFSYKCDGIDGYLFSCLRSDWRYCIPYEGNEHLLGTTDSSEED